MKRIKMAILALAIGTFTLQACGENTTDETTSADTTMLVPEADNTGEGISEAGTNDMNNNANNQSGTMTDTPVNGMDDPAQPDK